jgi:hypothetical protein
MQGSGRERAISFHTHVPIHQRGINPQAIGNLESQETKPALLGVLKSAPNSVRTIGSFIE